MNSYDLALEVIQDGRVRATLSNLVEYFDQINQEDYDDCAC